MTGPTCSSGNTVHSPARATSGHRSRRRPGWLRALGDPATPIVLTLICVVTGGCLTRVLLAQANEDLRRRMEQEEEQRMFARSVLRKIQDDLARTHRVPMGEEEADAGPPAATASRTPDADILRARI